MTQVNIQKYFLSLRHTTSKEHDSLHFQEGNDAGKVIF